MMKVILTHGYFLHEDAVESEVMKPYPPLGLLFLSAWLKKNEIPNTVIDTTFLKIEELKDIFEQKQPEIIGIYSNLMTRANAIQLIGFIRKHNVLHNTRIIIGGPDARCHAENYLSEGADFIIPGEGEVTITELIRALKNGDTDSIPMIPGLFIWNNNCKMEFTGERKLMNLNGIPAPAYDEINVETYRRHWLERHGYSSMNVSTMRGCPYSCNWCSKSVFGNVVRRRDAESVVEEMSQLKQLYNPDQLWFTDDVFTISNKWLLDFTHEIDKRDLDLPYECISRSDCMDYQTLELLKQSGCRKIWIGAESGSQDIIERMNRKINIAHTEKLMVKIKSFGISVGIFIMLGYHGEKKKDIVKTAQFLKKVLPDDLTIGLSYPINGTSYFQTIEPFFKQPYDWKSGSERTIRFKRSYSERFYRFATRYLHNIVAFEKERTGTRKWIKLIKAMISRGYILFFN